MYLEEKVEVFVIEANRLKPTGWNTSMLTKRKKRSLKESLMHYGQLKPVVVCKDYNGDESICRIIDGENVVAALKEINANYIVEVLSLGAIKEHEARQVHLVLNTNKGDQDPEKLADAIESIITSDIDCAGDLISRVIPLTRSPLAMIDMLRSRAKKKSVPALEKEKGWVNFSFHVPYDAASVCDNALSMVERLAGVEKHRAFELICADYLSGANGEQDGK